MQPETSNGNQSYDVNIENENENSSILLPQFVLDNSPSNQDKVAPHIERLHRYVMIIYL